MKISKGEFIKQQIGTILYEHIVTRQPCYSVFQALKALHLPFKNDEWLEKLKHIHFINTDNSPTPEHLANHNLKFVKNTITGDLSSKHIVSITEKGLFYLSKKFNAKIDTAIKLDIEIGGEKK